ncbi:aldehyde dehydrogenase (NADP(+)) [Microbacterium aurantiacum]|uniref:Aldehyde dehydrogenase (NADP(+)) n=1 Tax=Microbacterium aurantiacum TaxID=162393 RepID=A0AAJ2HGE9_9MICO|nr:aldehyde dehydrogenase (NADP(+)) [Microbacterium aurantiacum]MDS0244259.1 aldehyde dehydrogenase (NADP(+)) [Microbacterium aurantiacum]
MTVLTPTSDAEVIDVVSRAAEAFPVWSRLEREQRAVVLEDIAAELEGARDELVRIAGEETHLAEGRLNGELTRTTFQLRLFGEVLRDGGYLGVRLDPADPEWPMGAPRPDLRRTARPLGPVVVYAASNFPFAFSVAGGDTASALAAGCTVVVKAHTGHPALSALTGDLVRRVIASHGLPGGVFSVVFGTQAGVAVLQDARIKAGAFTGSIAGGRALFDIAVSRPEPIPFYGELGSVNPVFVTAAAAEARAESIAAGFIGSMTGSAGQLCTKPGVLVVPEDSAIRGMLAAADLGPAQPLLNPRIQSGYVAAVQTLRAHPGVEVLAGSADALADPPAPSLHGTDIDSVLADSERLMAESFGPSALVVTYRDRAQLLELARVMDGQLTATIIGEADEEDLEPLVESLASRAGRVLWNQWPTGVSVTFAQQHGGPYPATTAAGTTSVGTSAIERFVRPVAYQGFPAHLLPAELRDA